MEKLELLNKIKNVKKGSYIKLKKIKNLGNEIIKENELVVRLGINYNNISSNINKDNGMRWGSWVKGLENFIIEYNGKYYLRVNSILNNKIKSKSKYLLNGIEVNKTDIVNLVKNKKDLEVSKGSLVYNINIENILDLGY